MNIRALPLIVATFVVVAYLVGSSLYILYPWQSALVLQFGKAITVKKEAGLYIKAPWQNLRIFDSRILTIDTSEPERYITSEKENVLVDSYIKWRIVNPKLFYISFGGNEATAVARLLQIINSGLRDEIGKYTVKGVVAGKREEMMETMRQQANTLAQETGMEVVDVRLKRVNLPAAVSENVYKNMIEERRRIANERRSTGEAEKEKIQAEADRDKEVILAEAVREAERTRGVGDAEKAKIYAQAFGAYAEFYDFYRSLEAYRNSLGNSGDFFILSPDSDFFKYLKNQKGVKPVVPKAESSGLSGNAKGNNQ
ncbi:MAG: protease modulator HflC [Candidatus Zeuxoniibacter abyssi]|nr:MAG: protease modulator HflC [Candidatus Persebacteraceae bacterium AB1(2)]